MSTEETVRPKRLHAALAVLISIALFDLGIVVDQTLRWSNSLRGFQNGVFHALLASFAVCVYIVPWSLVICGLYRWRKWKRFRTVWLLLPGFLLFASSIVSLIADPPTANGAFERVVASPMPSSVTNVRAFRMGGGIADYTYLIYFEIDPADFDELLDTRPYGEAQIRQISTVRLFRTSHGTNSFRPGYERIIGDDEGWPSPYEWGEVEVYEHHTDLGWSYWLIADREHRRVYFEAGCI